MNKKHYTLCVRDNDDGTIAGSKFTPVFGTFNCFDMQKEISRWRIDYAKRDLQILITPVIEEAA